MRVGMYGGKFLPVHMGHVNMIVQARNMCDRLYVVLSFSNIRDRLMCRNIKEMPARVRLSWLRQITKDMEDVEVIAVEDYAEDDESYDWEEGARRIRQAIGRIDIVFSSEEGYEEIFSKLYPGAVHAVIDPGRREFSICARDIRKDGPFMHWEMLPKAVRPYFARKVVIVGTESSGKSTLVRNLAKVFNTSYVEEYGRKMCEMKGGTDDVLHHDDFPFIAYGHKMLELEKQGRAHKVMFIDTESLVTRYYYNLYMGLDSGLFKEMAKHQDYDLWLYLEPDVDWVDDGTRKHGDEKTRNENNEAMKAILDEAGISYTRITGSYQERFSKAVKLTQGLIS